MSKQITDTMQAISDKVTAIQFESLAKMMEMLAGIDDFNTEGTGRTAMMVFADDYRNSSVDISLMLKDVLVTEIPENASGAEALNYCAKKIRETITAMVGSTH